MTQHALNIAIFVAEGMQLLDFAGPHDAFEAANVFRPGSYELTALGLLVKPVAVAGGLLVSPTASIYTNSQIDTLIVPGGKGIRKLHLNDKQANALRSMADRSRRVVGICTGSFLIAQLGLAKDKTIATHWRHSEELAENYPEINVDGRSLFVRDGELWTSAGITAGIDLALALIREDYGAPLAAAVARDLVVYLQRPGDQLQYAAPIATQSARAGTFADLITWMRTNLTADLSVYALADRTNMSTRNFARKFRKATGDPPARFVERLRLEVSRQILSQGVATIESVAATIGYKSPDSFRRAFERRFGVSPSFYRETFNTRRGSEL